MNKTKELRATVVDHILSPEHYHFYEQSIFSRLSEKQPVSSNESRMFIQHGLAQNQWGGLETIKAVSTLYKANIIIMKENGSCNMVRSASQYQHALIIAYRLNNASIYNHYDSVIDMNSEDTFLAAEFIMNNFK